MKFDCTFCDKKIDSKNQEQIEYCKSHQHELLPLPQDIKIHTKSSNKKPKSKTKVKGIVDNEFYVESVVIDGKQCFICKHLENNLITIKESLKENDREIVPLELNEYGYLPYSLTSSEFIDLTSHELSTEEILEEVKEQIDQFVVAKELDKNLILGDILLTYSQEWIHTLHFPYFVGETESGKSSVLHLGKWLNYRCLYGEDIPHADIYNFLGDDEEGTGTIAEDEAQEIWNDREKIRTYKNSYSKGSLKPRIVMTQNKKQQVYYKTFCPKWFAGEKVPQDKGFLERLAIVYMSEGFPPSNIKRASDKEKEQLQKLRNKLLIWKLQKVGTKFDHIESNLLGRDQELWEDFLSVVAKTKFYEKCKNVVSYYIKQRHATIQNSLEAKLLKLVLDKIGPDFELSFVAYWDYITNDNSELPGKLDERGSKTYYPDDYPNRITHNSLSKIFEYKFQGEKHQRKIRDSAGVQHQTTTYVFQKEILEKLISKYGIQLPVDHPIYGGSCGSPGQQTLQNDHHVDHVHDSNPTKEYAENDTNASKLGVRNDT